MKTLHVCLLLSAVLCISCNGTPSSSEEQGEVANYSMESDNLSCVISAEIPETAVQKAVGEWMDEQLGGYYPGDAADMKAIVDFYGKAITDSLQRELSENQPFAVDFEAIMEKSYETPKFVTYTLSTCLGLGGAHPSSRELGATFRKSDGRRLSWDIVRPSARNDFNEILLKSLCSYFAVDNPEELAEQLVDINVYGLPLPETPPYLLENGVVAIYQQYEIAAYACGMPVDTIPYSSMLPVMTEWSKELLSE